MIRRVLVLFGLLGGMMMATAQTPPGDLDAPKVTGVEVARPGGGFLGLAVEGNAFVLRFYDAEKQEIPATAARAAVRWNSPQKAGQQRGILNNVGGKLVSPAVVRPPLAFVAYVTLLDEAGEALESHAFNLRTL